MEPDYDIIESPPRRRRQFTIRAILFAMLLVAIAAAGFSGLIRTDQEGLPTTFVLFIVAAPLALLLLANVARAVERFLEARSRSRESDSE
jgi:hypothetical protein